MTLVRFPGGEVVDVPEELAAQMIQSQADYAELEQDFADTRKRLAYKLFMGRFELDRHTLGTPVSNDVSHHRCVLCGGRFANGGQIRGFWNGPHYAYLHEGCNTDSEGWTK